MRIIVEVPKICIIDINFSTLENEPKLGRNHNLSSPTQSARILTHYGNSPQTSLSAAAGHSFITEKSQISFGTNYSCPKVFQRKTKKT